MVLAWKDGKSLQAVVVACVLCQGALIAVQAQGTYPVSSNEPYETVQSATPRAMPQATLPQQPMLPAPPPQAPLSQHSLPAPPKAAVVPYSAPAPGLQPSGATAASPAVLPQTTAGAYGRLPLNAGNAVARLEELRNLMPNSRPKDFQDAIGEYCDWLSDMADAHWRLAQSFAKADSTKAQSESEKQLCLKFGSLKRQAVLLKAEFLIGQKRYPEALAPLVEIVAAEPRSETGKSAYGLLQQIGFSEQVQAPVVSAAAVQSAKSDPPPGSQVPSQPKGSTAAH